MKKQIISALFLILVLLVLSYPSNAASNYYGSFSLQNTRLTSPAGMRSIDMLDKDNFWAVGINGWAIKYSSGTFTRPSAASFAANETLLDVMALDSTNVVALSVYTDVDPSLSKCYLYATTNGGTTFTKTNITNVMLGDGVKMYFVSTYEGFIVCNTTTRSNLYYNNSPDWSSPLREFSVGGGIGIALHDVFFVDTNNGWVCGENSTNNRIFRTTNGGKTVAGDWSSVYDVAGTGLNAIYFVDENNGWCVGNGGVILKSTDGGTTWPTAQTSGTTNNLYGVKFINANIGVAVGARNTILRTIDGGATWVSQIATSTNTIYGVDCVSGSLISWAVGEDAGNNAVVLKYNQPSITSVSPESIVQGTTKNITIEGYNFENSATVAFSGMGITANTTTITSSREINVEAIVSASAATGIRSITVTNPETSAITSDNCFMVTSSTLTTETPTITSINPSFITQGESKSFTITGTKFQTGASVAFSGSGLTASLVTAAPSTKITLTIAAAAAAAVGSRNVIVTNPDGGAVISSGALTVLPSSSTDNPDITSIVPASGTQGQTLNIILNGTNFPYPLAGKSVTLDFGDANITSSSVSPLSTTQVSAQIKIGASANVGAHDVSMVVYNSSGIPIGATVEVNAFTVLPSNGNKATIISENPWKPADGGLTLQIEVLEAGTYRVVVTLLDKVVLDQQAVFIAGQNNFTISNAYTNFSSGIHMVYVLKDNKVLGKWKLMIVN